MQTLSAEMKQISDMFLTFYLYVSMEELMNTNNNILLIFRFWSCVTKLTQLYSCSCPNVFVTSTAFWRHFIFN